MTPPAVTPQPDNLIPSPTDPARFGWGSAIAMAIPALLLGWLVYTNAVNVPYMDEWDEVPFIVKEANGTLGFHDFWKQHNEHRLIVQRAFFAVTSRLSEGDYRAMMAVSVVLTGVSALNVFLLLRKTVRIEQAWLRAALALLLASLLFSPAQQQNWLWGLQIVFFLPFVCVTTAAVVAQQLWSARWKYGACAVLAWVATYSLASGMVAWFAYPVMLVMADAGLTDRKKTARLLAGWVLVGALCAASYLYGYEKPAGHPSLFAAIERPDHALRYMLLLAGGSMSGLSRGGSVLVVAGVIGALAFALLIVTTVRVILDVRSTDRKALDFALVRRLSGWAGILLFTLGTMTLSCMGRVGFGPTQALDSRYATFSVYLLVSVVIIAFVNAIYRRGGRVGGIMALLVVALLVLQGRAWTTGMSRMHQTSIARQIARTGLQLSQVLPQDMRLRMLHPIPQRVRENALQLLAVNRLRPGLVTSTDPTPLTDRKLGRGEVNPPIFLPDGQILLTGRTARTSSPDIADTPPSSFKTPDGVLFSIDGDDGVPVLFRLINITAPKSTDANVRNPDRPDLKWSVTFRRPNDNASTYTLRVWGFDGQLLRVFPIGQSVDLVWP